MYTQKKSAVQIKSRAICLLSSKLIWRNNWGRLLTHWNIRSLIVYDFCWEPVAQDDTGYIMLLTSLSDVPLL